MKVRNKEIGGKIPLVGRNTLLLMESRPPHFAGPTFMRSASYRYFNAQPGRPNYNEQKQRRDNDTMPLVDTQSQI